MNRMEAIIRHSGTWVDAAWAFDEPVSTHVPPVLPGDVPRVCEDCGRAYHPQKGATAHVCAPCQGRRRVALRISRSHFGESDRRLGG